MRLIPVLMGAALVAPLTPAVHTVHAQAQQQSPPAIAVTSTAEVKVTPDRATVRISVQTKAATAAMAAADNAKKQTSVIESLRKIGIANENISTTDYNVSPTYQYPQNREPILTGYTVTNTVVVEVKDLSLVGKVLDASLNNGANLISSLNFYAANTDLARRQAISEATAKARADADAAAKAAGGAIVGLIELDVSGNMPYPPPQPMYRTAMAAKDVAETPVSPGQQSVSVTVSTRWLFAQSR